MILINTSMNFSKCALPLRCRIFSRMLWKYVFVPFHSRIKPNIVLIPWKPTRSEQKFLKKYFPYEGPTKSGEPSLVSQKVKGNCFMRHGIGSRTFLENLCTTLSQDGSLCNASMMAWLSLIDRWWMPHVGALLC